MLHREVRATRLSSEPRGPLASAGCPWGQAESRGADILIGTAARRLGKNREGATVRQHGSPRADSGSSGASKQPAHKDKHTEHGTSLAGEEAVSSAGSGSTAVAAAVRR